jgi:hypothetical protein
MSPETAVRETLPAPQCCSRTFVELYEKRRFLRKLRTAKEVLFEDGVEKLGARNFDSIHHLIK